MGGVGADKVGLGCHDFRLFLLGHDVLACPEQCLRDGHVQEVFPSLGLQLFHLLLVELGVILVLLRQGGDGPLGPHEHRAPALH